MVSAARDTDSRRNMQANKRGRIDMSELGMGFVWRSLHPSKFRAAVLKSQLS
jgi:hypothetical protein